MLLQIRKNLPSALHDCTVNFRQGKNLVHFFFFCLRSLKYHLQAGNCFCFLDSFKECSFISYFLWKYYGPICFIRFFHWCFIRDDFVCFETLLSCMVPSHTFTVQAETCIFHFKLEFKLEITASLSWITFIVLDK